MPLNILICGGGCAGPALAFWLARNGHQVTVVERFPVLRAHGAQVDLRGQGIEVAKRMGLIDAIRSKLVDEEGVAFVDSKGKVYGTMMAKRTGKGAQSLTSEYEIMRGDLICILYDATKYNVKYIFGKTVDKFDQDEKQVIAHFSDGSLGTFDILVGADGQGSRIRNAILSPESPDPCFGMGMHMAYWFIPRTEQDSNIRASVEQQKEFWAQRYRDAGWEVDRFLDGMRNTPNWYCQEIIQVRTNTWSKGRVVLLGDAAHCASPLSGMGTTGALIGAYVLAGEICRHPDDLPLAFSNYDQNLRPFVGEIQQINFNLMRFALPESEWAVALLRFCGWLACLLRIPQIVARFSQENKGGWVIPDYPDVQMSGSH